MLGNFMKTETSSFRLDKEVFTAFKIEAKKQHLSVNSLINKTIKQYVEWGVFASAIQNIPYPTPIILTLLKPLSEQQIRKIGKEYAIKHVAENLLLLKNEQTVDAYLELVQNWCEASGFAYALREKNDLRTLTARHNQGTKFSILVAEVIRTGIEELFGTKADVKQTTNSVSFSI